MMPSGLAEVERAKKDGRWDRAYESQSRASVPEDLEKALARNPRAKRSFAALETLPPRFREILVLRELEGCSYKEIAAITSIPIGTVMSSLSRARRQLHSALANSSHKEKEVVREV